MTNLYFQYISKLYSKSFIMMLLGITVSITMIDYLKNFDDLDGFSNQMILYLFYTWEFRLEQFYPLAIVFSAIITYMSLVKSNTFVAMYSFGYSKRELFIPFIAPAFIVYLFLIVLQLGAFSYARERAWSTLHNTDSVRAVNDLFFKYGNSFVYVKELDPIQKTIRGVTVFKLHNAEVKSTITLDKAKFDGEYWVAKNAILTTKKYTKDALLDGFHKKNTGVYKLLRNYRPKVIELIYEGESLSLIDAINTYKILKEQGLDSDKIRATFYSKVILPLFVFVIMTILFFKTSYHSRYMNQELVWALSLGGTLVIWGLLYALYTLSASGAILSELGIVLPVGLSILYALHLFFHEAKRDF